MKLSALPALLLAGGLGLAACADAPPEESAQDVFWARLQALCGQAFPGTAVEGPVGDTTFTTRELVAHVRSCTAEEIRIPFHVGEDRSRTWVLTRTATGIRLKHDHRHEDGSDDDSTMYGGDSVAAGTAERQEFPVDQYSIDMFDAAGNTASQTNIWAMEVRPGQEFVYELARPGGRLFRVEFDLTQPIAPPPAPWGDED